VSFLIRTVNVFSKSMFGAVGVVGTTDANRARRLIPTFMGRTFGRSSGSHDGIRWIMVLLLDWRIEVGEGGSNFLSQERDLAEGV
jgi:hypothetical protein